MGLKFGNCVSEFGPVLGCHVGWDLESVGCFEEFGCCWDSFVYFLVLLVLGMVFLGSRL